jgi:hypothetical protein
MRPLGWVSKLGPLLLVVASIGAGSAWLPATLVADTGLGCTCMSPRDRFQPSGRVVGSWAGRRCPGSAEHRLSTKGDVSGRVLTVNTAAGTLTKNLSAESFAAPAQSNVVVFGQSNTGSASTVSAIDLQTGCEYSLWWTADVVRSAVVDTDLQSLYVHLVNSADRSDAGVLRVALTSGSAVVALPL